MHHWYFNWFPLGFTFNLQFCLPLGTNSPGEKDNTFSPVGTGIVP